MTIDEAKAFLQSRIDLIDKHYPQVEDYREALDLAIKALEEVERYTFEIAECKAILDNPTPDVTENDKKRATYVLQTFPDMRGV